MKIVDIGKFVENVTGIEKVTYWDNGGFANTEILFTNGLTASVITGGIAQATPWETFEVAIFNENDKFVSKIFNNEVKGHCDYNEVNETLKLVSRVI